MSANEKKGKHLTWEEREEIRRGLKGGLPFSAIAEQMGRDPTTVAKEVKKNRYKKEVKRISWVNICSKQETCRKRDLCHRPKRGKCRIACRNCMECWHHCKEYVPAACRVGERAPYVCNGCRKQGRCRLDKYYYGPDSAQHKYQATLVNARQGICLTPDELSGLDNLVSPLLRKGQPLSHILAAHRRDIHISQRTMYRYIDAGYLSVRNLDMRRTVRYKPRHKRQTPVPAKRKDGHRYEDFCRLIKESPQAKVVEMDTVEGSHSEQRLLTLFFRDTHLMLIRLIPNGEMGAVLAVLNDLERLLGTPSFRELIPVLLTDNGTEFADPQLFESGMDGEQRTRIYYCDARMSGQKGRLEKNHEYIRYVLPKGSSFNNLTAEKVRTLMNHINNTARPGCGNTTPVSLALQQMKPETFASLGLVRIPPDEINLTRTLIGG